MSTQCLDDVTENWYFTFGFGHRVGNVSLSRRYVKLRGSMSSTRDEMHRRRGETWAFQYNEEQFLPQIKDYGLVEISLDEVAVKD